MAKLLPALVFLIVIISALFISPIAKIKKVDLNRQSCLTENDANEVLIGKHFLTVDGDKLESELKNKFTCLSDVQVTKQFPSSINMKIIAKEPIAKIEGTNLSATESGELITFDGREPTLYLLEDVKSQLGSKITDETTLFALTLGSFLSKTDYTVATIRITRDKEIAIYNNQGTIALFTKEKTANFQVDSLQQVLGASKISSSKIAKIDLRFDKPVVTYNNSQ